MNIARSHSLHNCMYAGQSSASAVAEGSTYGYGGTDQHLASQPRSQRGGTYGYGGGEQPSPSSQHNVPGSRGVMWPHLVPSSSNSHTLASSSQGLPAYPSNTPQSTPVAGSYNPYAPGAYDTGHQPASMVAQLSDGAASCPNVAASASPPSTQPTRQALPPRNTSHRLLQPMRSPSGVPVPAPMLPSISLTAADAEGGAFARAPYPSTVPQSLGQPSALTRSASASSYRIPGPQSLSSIYEGRHANSEIQRVATGPPGLHTNGGMSQSGMMERTTSYGSESFSLHPKSCMRWAAISETLASESEGLHGTGSAMPQRQLTQAQSAATSSEQVFLTAGLQPGVSGGAGSPGTQGSGVASTDPSKMSSGQQLAADKSPNSSASGT